MWMLGNIFCDNCQTENNFKDLLEHWSLNMILTLIYIIVTSAVLLQHNLLLINQYKYFKLVNNGLYQTTFFN